MISDSVLIFWRYICVQKRTGIKDSEIDDFVSKANAVDAAIRGMRDGTVDPDKIQIDGVDCDSVEVREEKEVSFRKPWL